MKDFYNGDGKRYPIDYFLYKKILLKRFYYNFNT